MKWEQELGGRVQQQQLQGSSKFKGDVENMQPCGFWTQNLLGRARVRTKNPCVTEYLVKQ
jgi:hypothetical protein